MKKLIPLILLLGWGQVWAIPVMWTLDGVTLEEPVWDRDFTLTGELYYGAGVTGSFVYDADTNIYSDVFITTEEGNPPPFIFWIEQTYTEDAFTFFGSPVRSASSDGVTLAKNYSCGFDFCDGILSLVYTSSLTNSGGTVALDTSGVSKEHFVAAGGGFVAERYIISGTLTGTVVPIPAAVWLFGSGLGLLGWMKRKRA